MVTIACVLYQGEDVPSHSVGVFTPEWVDRLYRGVKRNTTRPFRFVCFVDRDYEFNEPIETKKLVMPYRNMFSLLEPFREDMGRVVFMGLDTIITGNIDKLMDYDGPFAMLKDPYFERPCSGVMLFPYTPEVWEAFTRDHERHAKEHTMFGTPSDMIFLATVPHEVIDGPEWGIYSYKAHIKKSPDLLGKARVVYFHGKEKPHELTEGWVLEHWGFPMHITGFLSGLNTSSEVMLEQTLANLERDLPMFVSQPPHDGVALIVGGGPSLKDSLMDLRFKKQRGGIVFALNGTHDWLIERGLIPDFHVLLDARPENVRFVKNPHKKVTYLISAQCHPSIFEALEGHSVVMWVSCLEKESQEKIVGERFRHKPIGMIAGGATVGLKAMYLAYLWGFRKMQFYGFDSSYRGEENHAYRQDLNDKESRIEVQAAGKTFICAPWMAKQAVEFQKQLRQLSELGCSFSVHGDGLIPWICQQHRKAA